MRYSEIAYHYNVTVLSTRLESKKLTREELDNLSKYNYTASWGRLGRDGKTLLFLIFTEKHYLYNISVILKAFLRFTSSNYKFYSSLNNALRDFIKAEELQGDLSL